MWCDLVRYRARVLVRCIGRLRAMRVARSMRVVHSLFCLFEDTTDQVFFWVEGSHGKTALCQELSGLCDGIVTKVEDGSCKNCACACFESFGQVFKVACAAACGDGHVDRFCDGTQQF